MNSLQTIREGRSAARHLRNLAETSCLTLPDAQRLLVKIEAAFNEVMPDQPRRPELTVFDGGRS